MHTVLCLTHILQGYLSINIVPDRLISTYDGYNASKPTQGMQIHESYLIYKNW